MQNFSQKKKSQRSVSSSNKQSGTDGLLSSIEKEGEGYKEADVVSVWQQLADAAESMSQEDRESKIHKTKGFQTLVGEKLPAPSAVRSPMMLCCRTTSVAVQDMVEPYTQSC